MQEKSAHALRAKAPIRANFWRNATDQVLVGGMLANNDDAWMEFIGRFDDLLTQRIRSALRRWSPSLLTTETIQSVEGDILAFLIEHDMEPLRLFDPAHGALSTWLTRIAFAATMQHLRELTTVPENDEVLE